MSSSIVRRCCSATATLGFAVFLPLSAASSVHAADRQECSDIGIEYTADRGQHWLAGGAIEQEKPATRVDVRLKGEPAAGCQYVLSLASYSTEGPDWPTSGTQKFLGSDTVTLTRDLAQTVLEVTDFAPECFGQIDLYSGDRKFDGKDAPLPHYPNGQMGSALIAHWNGGTECEAAPPSSSPSPSATTPAPSASPSPSTTPAPSPSSSVSVTPSPAESSTTPTEAFPIQPPTRSTVPGTLASTGSDNTTSLAAALSAAVLLVAGGGMYLLTRRRRQLR
ncbi:LPXTG cell wall anchor domain-containing protein [Streptomyces sp. NPDC060030]|uniref:LPXTG cell wall anchor domain-containing protein n=1 Tax=Streptomyces sp. NPDC060030 TaxID=3347042 RepID=UPI00367FD163